MNVTRKPDVSAPRGKVPFALSKPCGLPDPADFEEWRGLRRMATTLRFPASVDLVPG
ncbi:MAG: hypothetical protein JO291_12405 [Acidimicrobiia bacterium]|nr:hypothetical protein [Acidimicrobiia bacterium]